MDLTSRLRALPVFPLPRVVLMPSGVLPLHVFEPRYRALVADALEGDQVFGVATLRPGYEADYDRSPPVFDEIGVGRIVQHEGMPDGRSNLVLVHVASARVLRERSDGLAYRTFEVEAVDGADPQEAALTGIRAMVLQLGTTSPDSGREAARLAGLPGMEVVHALARRLFTTADSQRAYLGVDQARRARLVSDALADLLGTTTAVGEA